MLQEGELLLDLILLFYGFHLLLDLFPTTFPFHQISKLSKFSFISSYSMQRLFQLTWRNDDFTMFGDFTLFGVYNL